MTAPIDKAAEAVDALWLEGPLGTGPSTADEARAVFASIDTDELARALSPWLGTGRSAQNAAEAVKAHLLKEDS